MEKAKQHYTFRMSLKLSKNYNSLEATVEYGAELEPNETLKHLIERVEKVVQTRLKEASADIHDMLGGK